MTSQEKKRVLMICLGNTCRSPIAEAVFQSHVKKMGLTDSWEVDSAALKKYHIGEGPNQRAMDILTKNGVKGYNNHVAKVIQARDFDYFDWILGMDEYNINRLNELKPRNSRAQVEFLGKYNPSGEIIIEDPYFVNDIASFQKVYEQCVASIESFLKKNAS